MNFAYYRPQIGLQHCNAATLPKVIHKNNKPK